MEERYLQEYDELILKILRYYFDENSYGSDDDLIMQCIISGLKSERAFCELCICIDTEMQEKGLK